MCSRDILFWINSFVWTFNPRNPDGMKVVPFITYKFQDQAILDLARSIDEGEDALIEKSRDMGASWIVLLVFDWFFLFRSMFSFLVVSRKEDLVDKKEDPDCLFWKLDFVHKNLPGFMTPRIDRTKLHFYNYATGGTIDGDSTTGDAGRGGRRSSILFDEFSSVEDGYAVLSASADTTDCRIFNSTPKGAGNAFYDLKMSDIFKLRFHWSEHPTKSAGLYTTGDDGEVRLLDGGYNHVRGYDFQLDGKLRSPWYDAECKRRKFASEIAQELDIDYLGSGYQYFDNDMLERVSQECVMEPFCTGEFEHDPYTVKVKRFTPGEGRFRLWTNIDDSGPQKFRYYAAADIATGTGSSNSVLVIGNDTTKEKILEFCDSRIKPHDFAVLSVALARYFNNARMIWEANGPGRNYGDAVVKTGYRNIYYRTNDKSLARKESDFPGFFTTRDSKIALLGDYRHSLSTGGIINRSHESIKECRFYTYNNGTIEHSVGSKTKDPSGARDNHGDRVIADALLSKLMSMKNEDYEDIIEVVPHGCLLERRLEGESNKQRDYW